MTSDCPAKKTLAIVGPGSNIATGNLIYKLGGIELPMLAKLQEKGINSYEEAVQYLKDTNEELYFYTPRHRVTVKDQIISSDGLLLIVTPPPLASGKLFTGSTEKQLTEAVSLFAQKKAIVLIKIPESHERSESVCKDLIQSVRDTLQELGISAESTLIIPSDLRGENFIEPSAKTPWHSSPTLVTALDEIFS